VFIEYINMISTNQARVTQLAKKFPAFYGTRGFIIVFTGARHWFLF